MEIDYAVFSRIMFIVLGVIFIFEGLEFVFDYGLNQYLFHVFLLILLFYIGVYVGKYWIE